MNLDETLRDKVSTHGAYEDTAQMAQALKMVIRRGRNWDTLTMDAKESLEHLATKVARILTGDATEPDHWNDAAGYMRLRANQLDSRVETGISRIARRLRPATEDGAA